METPRDPTRPTPRILVICSDRLGPRMAGGGIRAWELARALAGVGDVQLAGIEGSSPPDGTTPVLEYTLNHPHPLRPAIAEADVIVAQPPLPLLMGWLRASDARLVFDLYTPEVMEALEAHRGQTPALRSLLTGLTVDRLVKAMHIGHHFLCASDKQRDLWTGVMIGERLLGPAVYDRDPSLDSVIATVPFGIEDAPPPTGLPGPRERFPQIGLGDEIVLWNGGIWDWFDPLTAVRAIAALHADRPSVRLVFMSGVATHPPAIRAIERTRALAEELGVLDRVVLFNDDWVPYAERAGWLLQASCAVSTHVDQLETRYSFRTRLLDCFWAGLPIVCTEGDQLAGQVARDRLGAVVRPKDPAALRDALATVLDAGRDAYGPALAATADAYRWSNVTKPLVAFASAADRPPRLGDSLGGRTSVRASQHGRWNGYRAARATLNRIGLPDWPRIEPR